MAKTKLIVKEVDSKLPAKKSPKSKLQFTAGTNYDSKASIDVVSEPIKEVKDVIVDVDTSDKFTPAKVESFDLKESAAPIVKDSINLPVEETSPKKPAFVNHKLKGGSIRHNYVKSKGTTKHFKEIPGGDFPEHQANLARIIKNNAEIRRFTALGIINLLIQKGDIKGDKPYVKFEWNKFRVKYGTLVKEYEYSEPFFLNCLAAAFTSFAASAQKIIETFVDIEINKDNVDDIVNSKEVDNIVSAVQNRKK